MKTTETVPTRQFTSSSGAAASLPSPLWAPILLLPQAITRISAYEKWHFFNEKQFRRKFNIYYYTPPQGNGELKTHYPKHKSLKRIALPFLQSSFSLFKLYHYPPTHAAVPLISRSQLRRLCQRNKHRHPCNWNLVNKWQQSDCNAIISKGIYYFVVMYTIKTIVQEEEWTSVFMRYKPTSQHVAQSMVRGMVIAVITISL